MSWVIDKRASKQERRKQKEEGRARVSKTSASSFRSHKIIQALHVQVFCLIASEGGDKMSRSGEVVVVVTT
jgi:hypothetical protein